jgi:hypothetical protein
MFFSEEKNQKTFTFPQLHFFGPWPECAAGAEIKVFCFFSSEKKTLLSQVGSTQTSSEYRARCASAVKNRAGSAIACAISRRSNGSR